jgi:hypothetical protein
MESGSAIISGAQAGFAASGAGSTDTGALQAESEMASARLEASAKARMVLLEKGIGACPAPPGLFKPTSSQAQ